MKITVPLTFDIDLKVWADEYDLSRSEAAEDITRAIAQAAADGALADLIKREWQMMDDHTITVGSPVVDETDSTVS